MIDRTLLEDIGFEKGSGWDHEVWVYEGDFWVHYSNDFFGLPGQQINGNTATRKEFFKMFIAQIEKSIMESARVIF